LFRDQAKDPLLHDGFSWLSINVDAGLVEFYDSGASLLRRPDPMIHSVTLVFVVSVQKRLVAFAIVLAVSVGLGLIFFLMRRVGEFFTERALVSPEHFYPLKKEAPRIGDNKIVSKIGEGGMGTVFKAIDPRGSTVAVKVIGGIKHDRKAKANMSNRIGLVREARLAAELRHPNIVEIYDIGQQGGTLYVVMEYLEGVPLDRRMRGRRIGLSEGLRIVAQVCDALHYAHSRGVVHRDIKPGNIFIMADGTVKVLDFGLAFQGDELQGVPALAGTPPYMSPEQILGKNVDPRSDIWSAGITLFEIVTGKCPFFGPALFSRIVNGALPKFSDTTPNARDLDRIFEKALAKERGSRYESASDLAMDLRALLRNMKEADADAAVVSLPVDIGEAASVKTNDASELPVVSPRYDLGFAEQFSAQVFMLTPSNEKPSHIDRAMDRVLNVGLLLLTLVIAGAMFLGQFGLLAFAIGAGVLLIALTILIRGIRKMVSSPEALRCRSCKSTMRTASVWNRNVWMVDKTGFCVADCRAALKEGLWEDAVKLFVLHTTAERTNTRYKLQFLECESCRDQRAYFWFSIKVDVGWKAVWSEAYKFRDPCRAQEFMNAQKPPATPPHSTPVKGPLTPTIN
jgi:serine/threonine protein kinase